MMVDPVQDLDSLKKNISWAEPSPRDIRVVLRERAFYVLTLHFDDMHLHALFYAFSHESVGAMNLAKIALK